MLKLFIVKCVIKIPKKKTTPTPTRQRKFFNEFYITHTHTPTTTHSNVDHLPKLKHNSSVRARIFGTSIRQSSFRQKVHPKIITPSPPQLRTIIVRTHILAIQAMYVRAERRKTFVEKKTRPEAKARGSKFVLKINIKHKHQIC